MNPEMKRQKTRTARKAQNKGKSNTKRGTGSSKTGKEKENWHQKTMTKGVE